jgi:ATP-dependent RNA helicase DDX21
MGAPQAKDIISARAGQTIDALKEVDPTVIPYFQSTAKQFLEQCNDPVKALSLAFAIICNTTKPLPARSLISSDEGIITLLFRVSKQINNAGYIYF